jgi:hypothetical protein
MQNPVKERIVKLREEIAQKGCPAQWGIMSVGFKDCRKSLTNWYR